MRRFLGKYLSLSITIMVCLLLYLAAGLKFRDFFSLGVVINFFTDNAVLGIAALGMTFVILSGGIDLSVGSVAALSSMIIAQAMEQSWHPLLAFTIAIGIGAFIGFFSGCLIQFFHLPAFLVTLAGMFLARGLCFMIRMESIAINHPFYQKFSEVGVPLKGELQLPAIGLVFIGFVLGGIFLAHRTRFGRHVYALGGNEQSALLMGLPVRSTKILVYTLSGASAALAGWVYTVYTFSGNPTAGMGLELDAIAAVVIGGTLLSGGVGYVAGTLFGVLIFGIIQTAIIFQGTLSSWWTKIAVGVLLLIFILLQKVLQHKTAPRH